MFNSREGTATSRIPVPDETIASSVITPPPPGESQLKTAVHFSGAFSMMLQPGTDFGPRYHIEALLGEGGMGSVYKASDKELGRTVALKLVRPEFAANPAAMARFRQELLLASKISHKNVLRIHDLGDAGGIKFITMAYVDGTDLGRLIESTRLPLERVLSFARQLCSALDAAHSEEVVHRDLKPNNILIDKADNLYVMDFGLAKSIEAEATMMTRTGQILGTPRYMAPEQVEAKPIDHRADLYAFGLILYEMAAGEMPFQADSAMQLMYQRVTQKPKHVKLANPGVPDYLARIIMRCLEREPQARYQSAREILQDLEAEHAPNRTISITMPRSPGFSWKMAIVILLAMVVAVSGLVIAPRLRKLNPPTTAGPIAGVRDKYLAVLPFEVTGDDNRRYLADGLVEALSAKLLGLRNLYVSSPAVVARVNLAEAPDKIARTLGVKLLVRGTLGIKGDNLNLRISLEDIGSRRQMWASEFSGLRQDLLSIEDQVYTKLLAALDIRPSNEELARTNNRPTEDIAAYELYLRARNSRGARDVKSVTASMNLFDQAAKKDPGFALAYAGLADASIRMYELTKDNSWADRALAAATQAQRLNDNLPEVHTSLGGVYQTIGRNTEALAELQRALDLAPNSDDTYRRLGTASLAAGRTAEAVKAALKATQINPYYFFNYNVLGSIYLDSADYEKAAAAFRKVIELEPDNYTGYLNVAAVYLHQGQYKECIPLLRQSINLHPSYTAYEDLGTAFFYLDNYSEAVGMFEKAVELNPNQQVAVGNLADAYRWSGEVQKSKATYQRAITLAYKAFQVNPKDAKSLGGLALFYAKIGDSAQALQDIRRARAIDALDNSLAYKEGVIHALAGRQAEALTALREAFVKHYSVEEARHDPELAKLKSDPAFQQLLGDFSSGPKNQRR